MKISNEIRIAILAIAALLLFVFGFNYLKGNKVFGSDSQYFTVVENSKGLGKSDRVTLLGVPVGQVEDIQFNSDFSKVKLMISIAGNMQIPADSELVFNDGGLAFGSPSLNLVMGQSNDNLKPGSEIQSTIPKSMMASIESVTDSLPTTVSNLNTAILRLDSVASSVNHLVSGRNGANLERSISKLRASMENLDEASTDAKELIKNQSVRLDAIMANAQSITENIDGNKDRLNLIIANLETTSNKLAALEVQTTLTKVDDAMDQLNETIAKINEGDGSLALLINDDKLYNNLKNASADLDALVLDLKDNPKRYLPNLSVFGGGKKKNKKNAQSEN